MSISKANLFYGANLFFMYSNSIIYIQSYYSKILGFQKMDFNFHLNLAEECIRIVSIELKISHQNIII